MRRLLMSVLILFAGGCAVQQPDLSVTGAEYDQGLLVQVQLTNPNPFGLRISGVRYEVSVAEMVVASGERVDRFDLGPRDKMTLGFPLHVDLAAALTVLPRVLSDTVTYRLSGSYRLGTILGPRRMSFAGERRFAAGVEFGSALRQAFGGSR